MAKDEAVKVENGLHDYELIYIINPEITDEKLETTVSSISQYVTDRKGNVDKVDRWGKKKLAYPIKRHLEGNYILMRFKMDPALSKELETKLRITDDVLRHLLITVDTAE